MVLVLTFANLLLIFLFLNFSPREGSMPNILLPLTKMPSVCSPRENSTHARAGGGGIEGDMLEQRLKDEFLILKCYDVNLI